MRKLFKVGPGFWGQYLVLKDSVYLSSRTEEVRLTYEKRLGSTFLADHSE